MSASEKYILKEGQVLLASTPWFEEREIAKLPEQNQQHFIAALEDRFQELIDKVSELQKDFDQTEEKIKLAGKLVRTKSYIVTAKAIGDYASILAPLDKMEEVIRVEVEKVLKLKEALCVQAEELLKATEWKEATEKLREIQNLFKDLPSVPDLKNEDLKIRFDKAKDDFFKSKQASFESFEQDLLVNLSKKLELCEKAEALQHSTEWKKTAEVYQEMNEEWKKIGMVPKHRFEELWFRFSTAKDIFFNNKREHIEEIKVEHDVNLTKKLELVGKAQSLKDSTAWKKTSDEYALLMEEWKKIGRVSHDKSDEVWNQFLEAKNHFYQNKDAYYSGIKVQLEDNYAKKMAIVQHAESLQNSNDFEQTTKEYLDMFEEWKSIGRTPKEYGDDAWERFQKAKKIFFDRKDANREKRKSEMSKDIQERLGKNKSYYNKINRDLQREEELLYDVEDRIANLPPTLRSYEKREELKEMLEDIKENVDKLKAKVKEVKDKIFQDEREINYITRGPKKNNTNQKQEPKLEKQASSVETALVTESVVNETESHSMQSEPSTEIDNEFSNNEMAD